ncbi:MAG: hypothetical protein ABIJ08_01095 [Nanoarchaeota archaeon]
MKSKKRKYTPSSHNVFQKISGFKRVIPCRGCGKRVKLDKGNYCETCMGKFQKYRDEHPEKE